MASPDVIERILSLYRHTVNVSSTKDRVSSTRNLNLPLAMKHESEITIYRLVQNWHEELLRKCPHPTYEYWSDSVIALYTYYNSRKEDIGSICVILRTGYNGKVANPFI